MLPVMEKAYQTAYTDSGPTMSIAAILLFNSKSSTSLSIFTATQERGFIAISEAPLLEKHVGGKLKAVCHKASG